MSDGKYASQSGFGAMVRKWERSRERAATLEDGTAPVLFVSDAADGPPTDGSVFWYVTDESC